MSSSPSASQRICIFGAAPDTGNLGVSALLHSALGGIARFAPGSQVTVFDNGWGVRAGSSEHSGVRLEHQNIGARLSRRFHRPESFAHMRLSSRLGGLGNPGVRAVRQAHAVWDASGGDSFGDLYGLWRWRAVMEPKWLAIQNKRPLVLLPQTYGPFSSAATREPAVAALRQAHLAWARDRLSFETLRALLGTSFDRERHRPGVDMAFALETSQPQLELPAPLTLLLAQRRVPLIGINVSGLIYNDPQAAQSYALKADYPVLIRAIIQRFLDETEANLVLVSHVVPTHASPESDLVAAMSIWSALSTAQQERVHVLPAGLNASEIKWVMAQLDWFCGTRMHACIGAMSSGVPTLGLAYSLKFEGVFGSCAQRAAAVELRQLDNAQVMAMLWDSWESRDAVRVELSQRVPGVRQRAVEQLQETLAISADH